jgi:uncharacterized protein YcfJ
VFTRFRAGRTRYRGTRRNTAPDRKAIVRTHKKEGSMKKSLSALAVVSVVCVFLTVGCAQWEGLSSNTKTGAGIGAAAGGILGALIDSNQPWRGAIIGAAAGAAAGGWIAERTDKNVPAADSNSAVIDQASREAARQNATIKYSRTTENGVNEEVIATPISRSGNYRTVNIKYYRDGRLITSENREVKIS